MNGSDAIQEILEEVGVRISRLRGTRLGEQNTKASLITPVLRTLGWDTEDPEEVHMEYRRRPSDRPVDYALMLRRKPALFVEAKGLDEKLADRRWTTQIIGYAVEAGVGWVVLTNGDEYQVYNAHGPVPVEDKLLREVRISQEPQEAARALRLLSKEHVQADSLSTLWKAYSVERRLKEAVEGMFSPMPADWLVRRLAKELNGIAPRDIRAGLERARFRLEFPQERLPPPAAVSKPAEGTGGSAPAKSESKDQKSPKAYGVSVKNLIEAGLVSPPFELAAKYLGRELAARIEIDGRVTFGGESYPSLSTAAGMARASVRGAPPGRKYPQTNGWTFWQFQDDDGKRHELKVLRDRYLERSVPPS